ncbi:MAG: hypothetical protein K9N23_01840 [Akkermansiaceae bacterium]|nr:hypothetical protein [Akkermansiaceae bacterium]
MNTTRLLLSLFALALIPGAAPAGEPSAATRTVLLVTQGRGESWQDIAYLAAVPAACKANEGKAPAIALEEGGQIPREVADYLRRYKPAAIYHVGESPLAGAPEIGTLHELPASNAETATAALATTFWTSSDRVVLCRADDYASALMASTLAARLRVPLLACGSRGPDTLTTDTIRRLKATELLFVGKVPKGLDATELSDLRAVLSWMKTRKLETPYFALVNVRDRSGTTIRKLSLAAPLLASARDGMVAPLDRDIRWRLPFTGTPITGDVPKGIPTGKKPPKQGVIDLPEGKVPFVLSSGTSGNDAQLYLDLDGDGTFTGAGEGPFKSDGVIKLLGKSCHLDFGRKWGTECDLTVSSGSAEEICDELRQLYAEVGTPRYLCLVGFPDAIPQSIQPNNETDMTSDHPYGNADDDLFTEIAVGRLIGESATFATLHASRVVTYGSLLDPAWSEKAGQARWENTMIHNFENVGLDASAFHDQQNLKWIEPPSEGKKGKPEKSFSQDSPLTRVAFLTHMAHSWWKDLGQTYDMDSTTLLAPVLVESGGCLTCTLDYEPGFRSVISRFFRNGAVGFVGQTRPGIAHQEQQRAQFWNTVLAGGTIGDAHRAAQNSMTVTVLETGQTGGGPDHYQLQIRSLFGDPAFAPHLPSAPRSAPARVVVKDDLVSVHAPEKWWKVKMRVPEDWKQWADKPLYVIRGAGTYPHRYWCGDQYDREETFTNAELTTTRKVKSITQVQELPQPLGWTGKHTVDENLDGSRTYRWRVRLIDFDQQSGEIVTKLDRVDYRVEFE